MKVKDMKWVKYGSGLIGAFVAGLVIMFGSQYVVYPAISSLIGLAVAESATVWNSVRDGSVGDNVSNGVSYMTLGLWDGTNFDRARGDITNGLDVDVTRLPGAGTPTDAYANPTNALNTFSLGGIFNGSTWDRWRGQATPVQGATLLNATVTGSADSTNTITLTGVAGTRIHLYKLVARCSPAGTTSLSISDNAVITYAVFVPGTNQQLMEQWNPGMTISTGNNLVISALTCGAGNSSIIAYNADQF